MNITKKIVLIIVVFLSTLILIQIPSQAKRLDFGMNSGILSINEQDWEAEGWDVKLGMDYTFCVQQGQRATEGCTWTVQNYIRIEGRHSTFYVNNYDDDEHKLAEHENDENLMLAWILNQAFEPSDLSSYGEHPVYHSNIQKAVYGFFPKWAAANDYTIPTSTGNEEYLPYENGARNYVNAWKSQREASITNNTNKNNLTKEIIDYWGTAYIKIGPFNWTYTRTLDSVEVYDQNNNWINALYGKYNGTSLEVYANASDAAKSGQDFYILIPANQGISKINRIYASVSTNIQNLISEIWTLRLTDETHGVDEMQTIFTSESRVENTTDTASTEITDIELFGGLIINKTDADTGDALANVGFRLKMTSGAKAGQYVGVDGNGNAYYSSSPIDMRTNGYGQLIINSLYAGTYELTESVNPYFGYIKQPVVVASGIVVNAGQVTPQYVTNRKQYANLLIRKTDEDTTSAMSNVQFTLQKIGGTNAGQYVSLDGNGNAVYSSSVQYLTTSGNGRIFINYLYAGTYKLTETYNPNYGYEDTPKVITSNLTLTGGQVRTYDVTNKKIYGKLIIIKTDQDTGKTLSNIQFTIRKIGGDKNGQYVSVNRSGNAVYSTSKTTVTTNSNGRIEIDKMLEGNYQIVETSNPYYGYERVPITISSGTEVVAGEPRTANLTNELVYGKLKITKTDADTGEKKSNVGFTLRMTSGKKAGQYVSVNSSGEAVYSSSPSTIRTNSNGEININYIYKGTYELIETVNPYFGYENLPKTITSNLQVTAGETVTNVRATNRREYIKVSGFAWEDKTDGKNSTKDSVWKSGTADKRLQYVTVRLKKSNGQVIAETTTNANGEYIFGNYDENPNATKIRIDDLIGAYVEFEYNGMSYQSIGINSKFDRTEETNALGMEVVRYSSNTNKASDATRRDEFNDDFSTISKGKASNGNYNIRYNYDSKNHQSKVIYGNNVRYGYQGQTYPIAGVDNQYKIQAVTPKRSSNALCTDLTADSIRKNSVEEIGGLNLGVEERTMPDLFVLEDMQEVQISLNGYTHTYQYAQRFENPEDYAGGDPFNVSVRFANKYLENSYSRDVYSSDIVYNQNNEDSLQIHVTYMVKITNESSVYTRLNTLANYYDERYENIVVKDDKGNTLTTSSDRYNQNGLRRINIQTSNYLIAPGETKDLYITYQLNNEAINSILNEQLTLDSVTEVASYSSYSDANGRTPYAGIDVDSAPDTIQPKNVDGKINITDTIEDDTDKAPSLVLNVKEGRVIEGTVWEDSAREELLALTGYDKERKGNGTYESAENVVNNVKVELLTVTDTGYELAQLYQKHGANDRVVDAIVETDRQGKYSLVGVIPSKYVLRYTYGNNSVIVDTNGNTVKNVDIDNYKSTIYRKGSKDNANAMTDYWYRGETSNIAGVERLSDAKDTIGMKSDGTIIENIIQHRNAEEDINYETALTTGGVTQISADTRMFDIKLDYDINLDNTSGYGVDLKFVFDNIDFGIVERPRQSLIVDKQVSNIQIALPNGNELINGDPRSQNLSGVRVLDDDVYVEIDNEIIQGSTLTITYEISVDNSNCEIDYNNDDYYIYGTVPPGNADWKIATVVDMFDYLPEDLILQSTEGNNWERIDIQAKESEIKDKILAEKIYDEVKGRQNIIHLANPIFEGMTPGSESVDTSMVVSKLLSTSTDDLTYENDIEIIELKGRKTYDSIPGNYNPTTNESYDPYTDTYTGDELDDDEVEVTITPPTGENKVYWIYGVVGAVMLIVIGLGVVIIKKKVLKK